MLTSDLIALWVTFKLAAVTTVLLLIISTPLAWWLARSQWRYKFVIEAIIALPLILPPTVLGFYLLIMLGPNGPIGGLTTTLGGTPLAFTFTGLVIGSVFYSLPFVVQPLQNVFNGIGTNVLDQAATLRAGPVDRFFSVIFPLTKPGFLTATVLGFAHTIGEFGVVLMIGGNIPGSTQVVSIAIYDHVESLNYTSAHTLSALLLILSLIMLLTVYGLNRRFSVLRT
ncbi:Molybdenum transport system permease protein ModB [Methylophaga frappieri]|uniref:Molybdenum transport system permease n=2 Tax=Methylophaga frappieri (strain ATCC BAA-2434 / DSM 25690 / JAM7) TaxID=754477 RepID=I1YIJ7_METFJ|nr:Molybdenum transport system permease protein ModB [Methylophaga frappieri]